MAGDHRAFRAFTGVHPMVAEKIFMKYYHWFYLPDRSKLLMVLHYLKDMPSEDNACFTFKLGSRNTYRKWLWRVLYYLDHVMTEISYEKRFNDFVPTHGVFKGVSLIVDGTECPLDRPMTKTERLKYFSGRKKENAYSKYNLKYTVAVQVSTGRICGIVGPDIGSMSDIRAIQQSEIAVMLQENTGEPEFILGDKGYQGLHACLSPIKGSYLSPQEEAFNEVLASVRQLVECVFQRVKIFGVLGTRGRFHADPDRHKAVFNVCCQITNISMKREPVWLQKNFYLY